MLVGFIGGLIVAWVLSLFSVDVLIIDALQPFVRDVTLNTAMYYVAFGLIGLIGGAFKK